jgi:hypothetical protein
MSDDEEGEYDTIKHTASGKGVKLLYTKSKVRHVHLTMVATSIVNAPRSTCTLLRLPKTTFQAS